MLRTTRRIGLRALWPACVCILLGLIAAAPPYGGGLACFGRMIKDDRAGIDVAAVGTSRTQFGFVPARFVADRPPQAQHPLTVMNFGRSGYDWGQLYVLVRDLLERQKVSTLFVEVDFHGEEQGMPLEGKYQDTGLTLFDIWQDELAVRDGGLLERAGAAVSRSIVWVMRRARNLVSWVFPPKLPKPSIYGCTVPLLGNGFNPVNDLPELDQPSPNNHDLYYLRKIKELADLHHVRMIGVLYPRKSSNESGAYPVALAGIVQAIGVDLRFPPEEVRRRLDEAGYRDLAHFNAYGAEVFTDWLADQ